MMDGGVRAAIFAGALAGAAWTGAAWADGAAGRQIALKGVGDKVAACSSCHGLTGEGDPKTAVPRLAGQDKAYMAKELKGFRAGQRKNDRMSPVAQFLSDQQISDVVEYFAAAKARRPAPLERLPASEAERAASIFKTGLIRQGAPACASCHGLRGEGNAMAPEIMAQNAAYAMGRFTVFQTPRATPPPPASMREVAVRLGPADAKLMAAYLATLRP